MRSPKNKRGDKKQQFLLLVLKRNEKYGNTLAEQRWQQGRTNFEKPHEENRKTNRALKPNLLLVLPNNLVIENLFFQR